MLDVHSQVSSATKDVKLIIVIPFDIPGTNMPYMLSPFNRKK
jgi:hypothetical protein